MVEKNNKNIDGDLFDINRDVIPVKKIYNYTRYYIGKDGKKHPHTQSVERYVSKSIKDYRFTKELNKLVMSNINLNKVSRLLYSILRFNTYGKTNLKTLIQKATQQGNFSITTERLLWEVYNYQKSEATDMEKRLLLLLGVLQQERLDEKQLNKELNKLDAGDLD